MEICFISRFVRRISGVFLISLGSTLKGVCANRFMLYKREFIWSAALCILAAVCLLQSVQCLLFVVNFTLNVNTLILRMKILVMFFSEFCMCMYFCATTSDFFFNQSPFIQILLNKTKKNGKPIKKHKETSESSNCGSL